MTFPLVQPVLKIVFFVTMWDTPSSNESVGGGIAATIGTAVLNAAVPFLAGGFRNVEGLEAQATLESYHEGGVNDTELQFFKQAAYPKIVLKRGVTFNSDIWDWHHQVITGKRKTRKSGTIILMDHRKLFDVPGVSVPIPFQFFPVAAWTFHNALPEKLAAPALDAQAGEGAAAVAIESLEMRAEKIERLSLSLIPGVADLNSALSGLVGLAGAAAVGGIGAGVAAAVL
jgi:phage tail-like protein